MWTPGTKLIREHSPELGVGVVVAVEGRFIDVIFPDSETLLRLSPDAAGIRPVRLGVGHVVRESDGEEAVITAILGQVATLSNCLFSCDKSQEIPHTKEGVREIYEAYAEVMATDLAKQLVGR